MVWKIIFVEHIVWKIRKTVKEEHWVLEVEKFTFLIFRHVSDTIFNMGKLKKVFLLFYTEQNVPW